jgi:hypothetical protein
MDRLAQLRPGDSVSWLPVEIDTARQIVLQNATILQHTKQVIWGEATGKEYRIKLAGQEFYSFVQS